MFRKGIDRFKKFSSPENIAEMEELREKLLEAYKPERPKFTFEFWYTIFLIGIIIGANLMTN